MNSAPLPENMRDWPADDFGLFGLSHTATHRELRRAYARLVKFYKPEHFPKEFRRIRDAYEALEPMLRQREGEVDEGQADTASDTRTTVSTGDTEPADLASASAPRGRDESPLQSAALEIEELWRQAVRTGEVARAYPALAEHVDRTPQEGVAYARLFWLLVIAPELDPHRMPFDWLVRGLRQTQLDGRLLALYQQELNRTPELVGRDGTGDLLDAAAPAWQVAQLARTRWEAAGRTRQWQVIANDLRRLRAALSFERPTFYALVLFALDRLIWSEEYEARRLGHDLHQELQQAGDMQLKLSQELDRYELLLALAENWWQHRDSVPPLCERLMPLVPELWTQSIDDVRPQLLAALEPLVRDPYDALEQISEFHQSAPLVASCLRQALERQNYTLYYRRTDEDRSAVIASLTEFINGVDPDMYRTFRDETLRYFVNEVLSVADLLRVAEGFEQPFPPRIGAAMYLFAEDEPLRLVTAAHQFFWS
jgi:hypothetical protein